jgi:hypothetical protein
MRRRAPLSALLCLLSCNDHGDQTSGLSTTSVTTVTTQGTSSGGSSTGGSTSTSTGEDSTAAVSAGSSTGVAASTGGFPDGGPTPDGGPPPPPGCKGKIDFLFSIQSGKNMKTEQDKLKASFSGLIDTIEQEFADFDYHIMVGGTRGEIIACQGCQDTCPDGPPDYPCGEPLEPCDGKRGAGITLPRGWDASNKRCELYGGRRYIIKGEPKLLDAFSCIASVGTSGYYGLVEDAVLAISPDYLALDGCNAQFLRKDALLVVVIIAESDDDDSADHPEDWAQALLDAKGGDGDAIVLLVVSADNDEPQGLCQPTFNYYPRLREWVDLMPHGLFRSVCSPDFAPHFDEAVSLIKQQCEVFVPQ